MWSPGFGVVARFWYGRLVLTVVTRFWCGRPVLTVMKVKNNTDFIYTVLKVAAVWIECP